MEQKRTVTGTVMKLRCGNCGSTFPHFVFSGEKDTDTDGICSASSCEKNEVVIAELLQNEWNDLDNTGASNFQHRLSLLLDRHDLRVIRLVRVEQAQNPSAGLSFRDFAKSYEPPVLVFSCACCTNGESKLYEELTLDDFRLSGGNVLAVGHLVL